MKKGALGKPTKNWLKKGPWENIPINLFKKGGLDKTKKMVLKRGLEKTHQKMVKIRGLKPIGRQCSEAVLLPAAGRSEQNTVSLFYSLLNAFVNYFWEMFPDKRRRGWIKHGGMWGRQVGVRRISKPGVWNACLKNELLQVEVKVQLPQLSPLLTQLPRNDWPESSHNSIVLPEDIFSSDKKMRIYF